MKKFLALLVGICLAIGLAGCSNAEPDPISTSPSAVSGADSGSPYSSPSANTKAAMNAIVLPTVKESVTAEDGTILTSVSFQQAQIILHNPELESKIIGDFQSRISPILNNVYEIEEQARQDYPESDYWSEYFIDISYTPTRLDQAVVSLFGNTSSYSGGPHPSLVTDSVTYDLQTGEMVCLDDILTLECTPDKLYELVLKSLEPQVQNLYYDYADALGDRFTGELHSIQDWYFSHSGLCFHFAPYDIAPYSSGTVIAELPYDALTGILKEQYFPSEIPAATGSIYAETLTDDDRERFTFVADVPLCEDGYEVLLYTDDTVTDLRIESGSLIPNSNQYIALTTVFAASTVNVGDAIALNVNFENTDHTSRVVYHSGGQEYSAFVAYDSVGDTVLLTNSSTG